MTVTVLIDGLIGAAQMEEAAGDGDGTVVTRVKAIDPHHPADSVPGYT